MYLSLAFLAYLLDFIFSEFSKVKALTHPIILIGNLISFFNNHFYKDSVLRGAYLTLFTLFIVFTISFILSYIENLLIQAFLCSFTISSSMLYKSVKDVISSNKPKEEIAMLVSRDTSALSEEEINKACIETYAENLSDGVIAPLFYLCFFGLVGAFLYKAVNTLDSMVGYRNKKYEKYGKVSAILDDVLNYIPSRITAVLIASLFLSKKAFLYFYKYGSKHDSPNAGHPIAAMSLVLNIKLGGPTSYFGKVKEKAYFGDIQNQIKTTHVLKAISLKHRVDFLIGGFALIYIASFIL